MNIITELTDHLVTHSATWFFALLATGLGFLYRRLSKFIQDTAIQNRAMGEGVKMILADSITEKYYAYREKGYCPVYAKNNIKNIHKPYKDLNGNGVIDKLIDEMLDMPPQEKKKEGVI